MTDKLRIGIIGAGGVSQLVHIPIIKKHPNVELVAVADLEFSRAAAVADRFKIPLFFRDPERMLAREDIDAVHVNTPTNSHLALTLAALAAGKHVLVEKPIARKADEAKRMVAAAKSARKQLMAAMNLRFRPDSLLLHKMIHGGELGKIIAVRAGWHKKKDRWSRTPWLNNARISGGGVLMDTGIQMLDVCWWMLGNPAIKRVSAQVSRERLGFRVEDTLVAYYTLAGDTTFYLNTTWAFMSDESEAYTMVSGSKGSASLNPLKITKEVQGNLVNVTPAGKAPRLVDLYNKSFEIELDHFFQSVMQDTEVQSSGAEAAQLLDVIEATYRSASENREIVIGES
ncbi:Gfo/Idh/MocA family oxidoreductase [candidate division KSB1 bacterium]|nr:Gfo/Idh/MocA family oxidoreductase [candidate division KSB1 bacterium]